MHKIFHMEFGSHVYGTNLPTSDHDYKGIFLPTSREILLGVDKNTITTSTKPHAQAKNSSEDIDSEFFSLKQYMKLLLEGQTVALTMAFAPKHNILFQSAIYDILIADKSRFLHKGISAFAGYCRTQANRYGIRGSRVAAMRDAVDFFGNYPAAMRLRDIWPEVCENFRNKEHCEIIADMHPTNPNVLLSVCNRKVQQGTTVQEAYKIYKRGYGQRALMAERNEGVDWKALMHAVRVASEAKELLETHHITYPLPNAKLLLQIRQGMLPYQEVAALIEQGLTDLEIAQQRSTLPEKPDTQWAEDLVFTVYKELIKQHC